MSATVTQRTAKRRPVRRGPRHNARDFGMYSARESDWLDGQCGRVVSLAVRDRGAVGQAMGHAGRSSLDDWCAGSPSNVLRRFVPLLDTCENPDVLLAFLQARRDRRIRDMSDDELRAARDEAERMETEADCREAHVSDLVRIGAACEGKLASARLEDSAATARAALIGAEFKRRGLS